MENVTHTHTHTRNTAIEISRTYYNDILIFLLIEKISFDSIL